MRRYWKDVDYKRGEKRAERGEQTRTNMVSKMADSHERHDKEGSHAKKTCLSLGPISKN